VLLASLNRISMRIFREIDLDAYLFLGRIKLFILACGLVFQDGALSAFICRESNHVLMSIVNVGR